MARYDIRASSHSEHVTFQDPLTLEAALRNAS